MPLEAGSTDGDYAEVFKALVIPVIDQFRPELMLISAGYDAHERDPLARMRLSTSGYAALTKTLCDAADRHCHGRVVAVTEGGYDLTALKGCLESTITVLEDGPVATAGPAIPCRDIALAHGDRRRASGAGEVLEAIMSRWSLVVGR